MSVTSFDIDVCKLKTLSDSKLSCSLAFDVRTGATLSHDFVSGDLPLEHVYFINVQFVFINVQVGGAGGSWHGR